MNISFKNILVYGLGLMGGSIVHALRKKNFNLSITAIVKDKIESNAIQKENIVDTVFADEEFNKQSLWDNYDLILFCLPVHLICQKIQKIPSTYSGYITDIGSTKSEIIRTIEIKFPKVHNYYSSHPMAGSEHTGLKHANPDLFKNKLCILTAPQRVSDPAKKKISEFWKSLDMVTFEMDAMSHDEVFSYLSHTPHILSSLMVIWAYKNLTVSKSIDKCQIPLSGGGFRDMSRIAGSNPDMWDAIIQLNKEHIHKSLVEFQQNLSDLIKVIDSNHSSETGFWKSFFGKAKEARNRILKLKDE